MIRLTRGREPSELKDKKTQLLKKYKRTREPVWREIESLNASMLEFSNNKCAYCERSLDDRTVTVDHFHPRDFAPSEVLDWDNLLPCCKECNERKDNFNTLKYEFIDPCTDDPADYLCLDIHDLFFDVVEDKKKSFNTVDILKLNDMRSSLYKRRYTIKIEVDNTLKGLKDNYLIENAVLCMKDLLSHSDDKSELSAVYSTCILKSSYYNDVKNRICHDGGWDEELVRLESQAKCKCF